MPAADPLQAQPSDPQALADAVCEAMMATDRVGQGLGLQVVSVRPTSATLQMTVRDDMLNGLDVCHGGVLATLADAAFAVASNACNEATVASGFDIHLLAPALAGDVLTAVAIELSRGGRTGVYDVMVVNQRGERVAVLRGRSHAFKGRKVVPALPTARELRGPDDR